MANIGNTVTSVPFIADSFSGNASTTAFSPLTRAPAGTAAIAVFIAGVYQAPGTYTLSGVTITFASAPASGVGNIIVLHLGTGSATQVPSDGSVTITKLSSDTFSYINSAFTAANIATPAASYANSAFASANLISGVNTTQNTNITSASSYANSAFLSANTPSNVANSAATYANGAFAKANTAAVGTYVANSNNVILSANTQITANITILPNTGALSIGPITLDTDRTVTVSANSRWLVL